MAADFISTAIRVRQRYLNLLEAALTGMLHEDPSMAPWMGPGTYSANTRTVGGDWPATAQTMIGRARLRNLRQACESVILDEVPGDFLEAGVWRGGACILMRGILEAYGDTTRRVFVADSFKGLPPPSPELYPADTHDVLYTQKELAISRQQVEDNFRRYSLLDERVVFLEGWFKDTLPTAPG
jgi:O-methyltransferase/8-demethyl-8-(2,3-dimethoxy-alpha-L-rhamnosyl)tetracenomycin-C 4'-O-methyltransferase